MTPARVSVIVPCFNLGRYLDEALASIAAQTFADLDVLVVDDGSTDPATQRVLDRCERDGVRVVRTPNRGLPAAKNVGLAQTDGQYVCMFDADDRALPLLVERSVAVLDAEPDVAFVSHWLRTFGDEQHDWTPDDCTFPALLDVNTVNGAALVRRSALEQIGGFDESFHDGCEDWDLWIALVSRGFAGRILPEILFEYRRRAGSMSDRMAREGLHPALYRRLAEKHAAAFAGHLPTLLRRRERDLDALRLEIHRLELDYHDVLAPAHQSSRDDAAAAERARERRARASHLTAVEAERVDLAGDVARLSAQASALEAARHDAAAEVRRMERDLNASHAESQRLADDVRALRASWSWRVTSPLRHLYDWLGPKGGPP